MKGYLVRRDALEPKAEHAMYALCARYFRGVTRDGFRADLDEKNWVLLMRESDGTLAGFSTLHLYDASFDGAPIRVAYSGDTIVEEHAWGRSVLSAAWIGAIRRLHGDDAEVPLWWLLLVSGFRTFRFLPTFWRRWIPHPEGVTSEDERRLLGTLARQRLGESYDAERGIARLPHPMVLRRALRTVPEERLVDPLIRFFLERNPGHVRGDELVCLTEISPDNLAPAGARMWRAGQRALAPVLEGDGA